MNRLRDERRDLSSVLRSEFQSHLTQLESENRILKAECAAAKSSEERGRERAEEEIRNIRQRTEAERAILENRSEQRSL